LGFLETWLWSIAIIAAGAVALWLLSLALRNSSIVDIAWGPGFASVALFAALAGGGYGPRRVLIAALAIAWGVRLGGYIFVRNHGKGEDPRYQRMRRGHGARWWWWSFVQVFALQGALMWLISAPLVYAATADGADGWRITDVIGAAIWAVGFAFESVGDWQLARFKADPANKGQVMDRGLWRYTRHPNYFGDATLWWGLFVIACCDWPGLLTVISPIAMTVLLLRVSGVALLERSQVREKPGYRDYIERTSPFLPWFPRGATNDT
jgi:steroid 5-alpha reductase family enzyme